MRNIANGRSKAVNGDVDQEEKRCKQRLIAKKGQEDVEGTLVGEDR